MNPGLKVKTRTTKLRRIHNLVFTTSMPYYLERVSCAAHREAIVASQSSPPARQMQANRLCLRCGTHQVNSTWRSQPWHSLSNLKTTVRIKHGVARARVGSGFDKRRLVQRLFSGGGGDGPTQPPHSRQGGGGGARGQFRGQKFFGILCRK